MPPLYHRVWQYLKYKVNHEDKKIPMRDGSFFTVKKGQHLTSHRKIATDVGWYERMSWKEPNPKTIKSILDWLENQTMITVQHGKSNSQYTLITLLQWEKYQITIDESNTKVTVSNQLMDTNNNDLKNDLRTITTTDTDAPKENDQAKDDVDVIADRFRDLKTAQIGRESYPTLKDFEAIARIVARGMPLPQTIKLLEQCFKEYRLSNPNGAIHSFGYCEKYMTDKYEAIQAREEAKKEVATSYEARREGHEQIPRRDSKETASTGTEQGYYSHIGKRLS
jgi:hypothetical protein